MNWCITKSAVRPVKNQKSLHAESPYKDISGAQILSFLDIFFHHFLERTFKTSGYVLLYTRSFQNRDVF